MLTFSLIYLASIATLMLMYGFRALRAEELTLYRGVMGLLAIIGGAAAWASIIQLLRM